MISLKKYIESHAEELLASALASYCAALEAMGNSGMAACPPVSEEFRESLLALRQRLTPEATPDGLRDTGGQASTRIEEWGTRAACYIKQRAAEFKELTLILARTAELAGERDQRYVQQVQAFTGRLQAIADLNDLTEIRDSLFQSAKDLEACADQMSRESEQAVTQLRKEVETYQARLDDAEKMAGSDSLTGLDNRRKAESSIRCRMAARQPFSLVLVDLNGFKQINDTHGHVVGDEVLKQFATELRGAFRATDVVARWGGDEFVVVLDCDIREARGQIERLSQWVFGEYTIRAAGRVLKVPVEAAVGVTAWKPDETMEKLLERADAAMYKDKARRPRAAAKTG